MKTLVMLLIDSEDPRLRPATISAAAFAAVADAVMEAAPTGDDVLGVMLETEASMLLYAHTEGMRHLLERATPVGGRH